MDIFLQQIVNGLTLGAIYALVALGYTMVYGIISLINFAHGEVVMIGAMVAISVATAFVGSHINPIVLLLIGTAVAVPVCVIIAYTMEKIAYRPLRKAPRLAPLITAIGLSFVLQAFGILVWGRDYKSLPKAMDGKDLIITNTINFLGASITDVQIFMLILAAVLMGGLIFIVQKTKLGMAMRATAQNQQVAGLMGIDVNRIISSAFVIGAALAAVAGVMYVLYYNKAHYQMGFILGLKAFTAAVLGGVGNIAGAMAGGILLGVIEAFGGGYISELLSGDYTDITAFIVLILVLLFRPQGLFGERVADRA